ncbi:10851_t:CDS:2 [Funneliformis geosporum]|uniref:10851_t:CDS:1 n=1 Tax=Funneliformis geosporum TaxID=1117311 RepID=A0A9W4WTL4_9GLOM|nr:10851_t:CDS:2 [Funneliformis geosporum]
MPGWEDSLWGYYGDDRQMFFNTLSKLYGPKFMTSDTIGCYLNIRNNTIYYTRNRVNLDLKNENAIYPCVRIISPGGSVRVNLGYRKYNYTGIFTFI